MRSRSGYTRSLGHQLWLAGLAWQRAVRRALRPLDLTPTQFLVLDVSWTIRNRERDHLGPNQSQVAEETGLDRQTIHRIMVALEDRGLIERGPSHDTHESWCIDLLPAGKRALDEARPLVEEASQALLGPRREKLRSALEHIGA